METRINVGYVIVSNIVVGEFEFVLGHNPKAPSPFVTWEYSPRSGYYWGHYFEDELAAVQDLIDRAQSSLPTLWRNQRLAGR